MMNLIKNRPPLKALAALGLGLAMSLAAWAQPVERMVDVGGGRKLHAVSMGQGEYTVVFEHGFSMDLSSWRRVAPELAKRNQVLVYSRAGHGQSDPVAGAHTLQQSNQDLQALLSQSQLKPPYVLVGHSYGGWLIRDYAARHPEQVAGLVFVDAAHERLNQLLKPLDPARLAAETAQQESGAPERFKAAMRYANSIMDASRMPDEAPLPDVPTVVLTSTKIYAKPMAVLHTPAGMKIWRQLHTEFFAQFSQGAHVVTPNSGHFIQMDEPGLVVAAVDQVIGMAREGARKRALEAARGQLQAAVLAAEPLRGAEAEAAVQAAAQRALREQGLSEADLNNAGYDFVQRRKQPQLGVLLLRANALLNPESDNAADSHGEVLLQLGRVEAAREQFARALQLGEKNGRSPRVLESYRQNLIKARQPASAR